MKSENTTPNKVALGWIENGSRKDAIEYAKGYATKHFEAPAISWYAVMPILGGWLFEVQEGGPGRSHLPAVAKALSEGAELAWFRVARRAYSVSMRDNRPFCVLLPESDSKEILASETGKLQAKGKMDLVIKRGTTVLAVGLSIFSVGALFLIGAQTFHIISQNFVPIERSINPEILPHRQWAIVENTDPNSFVESLRIPAGAGQWETTVKPTFLAPPTDETAASPDTGVAPVEPLVPESQPVPDLQAPDAPAVDTNGNFIDNTQIVPEIQPDPVSEIQPDPNSQPAPATDFQPLPPDPSTTITDSNGNIISPDLSITPDQQAPVTLDPSVPVTDSNGNIVSVDEFGNPLPVVNDPNQPSAPAEIGQPLVPTDLGPGGESEETVNLPPIDPTNQLDPALPVLPNETLISPPGAPQEGI